MKKALLLAGCLIMCLAAPDAFAAIDNTHHDISKWTGGTSSVTCYACHGYKETSAVDNALGTVGTLCYNRCHIGTASLAPGFAIHSDFPNVGNENGAVLNTTVRSGDYPGGTATAVNKYATGHLRIWANTTAPTSTNIDNATKAAVTAAWPHVGSAPAAGQDIECTGCHDVHSNVNGPFLRAPMSTVAGGGGAGSITATFCVQCHIGGSSSGLGRWVDVTAFGNGSHPIEVNSAASATRATAKRTGLNRQGRKIQIKGTTGDNASVFKVATPNAPADLDTAAKHYVPGGHLGDLKTPADNGVVGCYTCHAVHLPSVASTGQQTVVSLGDPTGSSENRNYLCVACHGGADANNPGMTSYYHPVADSQLPTSGGGTAAAVYSFTGGMGNPITLTVNMLGIDVGVGGRLVCTSCHAPAHGGAPNTLMMRSDRPNCLSCHADAGTTANSHHKTGTGNYNSAALGGYNAPSYAASNPGVSLLDGLGCEDCHVVTPTGSAHNWTSPN